MKKEAEGTWSLALHAGTSNDSEGMDATVVKLYTVAMEKALEIGTTILESCEGSSLEAVTKVVVYLEDNPLFNAGKGSAQNVQGQYRLGASIMQGDRLRAGAVADLRTVKNPILLARRVMEKTESIVLVSDGAEAFADCQKVPRVCQSYFAAASKKKDIGNGTVGCVALDQKGRLAAATSTGGLVGKPLGRMGDSSTIGAGTYAKAGVCAVSATGKGEEFIRHSVASRICCMMEYGKYSLEEAINQVIFKELCPGDGGVIVVDHRGNISMSFNTKYMLGAIATHRGKKHIQELSCGWGSSQVLIPNVSYRPINPREFW